MGVTESEVRESSTISVAQVETPSDVYVMGMYESGESSTDDAMLAQMTEGAHASMAASGFVGKRSQVTSVSVGDRLVYLVGLGSEVDQESLRHAAGSVGAKLGRVATVSTSLHAVDIDGATRSVVEGFALGQYQFTEYQDSDIAGSQRLELVGSADADEIATALLTVTHVAWARDLVNRPPRDKAPRVIADSFTRLVAHLPIDVTVWGLDELARERCGGVLGVNAGSTEPARMVIAEYAPPGATETVAIVGKGIVFDSGGLNIKPYEGMKTMKSDMAGAATVLGAVATIAELGLNVRVLAYTPLTENMPSGAANRPGDVLTARNGKTIEVLNTDAEGRLVLADALALAAEQDPSIIVDVATLTGAAHVALGHSYAGLWSNNDLASSHVVAAASQVGEKVWPMPLPAEYRKALDSEVADMKNVGERYGGAITAALFLEEFVGDAPWVHLDIAGPGWGHEKAGYVQIGGTGFGVRTLVQLAANISDSGFQ